MDSYFVWGVSINNKQTNRNSREYHNAAPISSLRKVREHEQFPIKNLQRLESIANRGLVRPCGTDRILLDVEFFQRRTPCADQGHQLLEGRLIFRIVLTIPQLVPEQAQVLQVG